MNRHTAPPFRAPSGKPRTHVEEQCAGIALLSPLFDIWAVRDRTKANSGGDRYPRTNDRRAPSLTALTGSNSKPPEEVFELHWISQTTAIESAVDQWLKPAYPEIYRELLQRACDDAGLPARPSPEEEF